MARPARDGVEGLFASTEAFADRVRQPEDSANQSGRERVRSNQSAAANTVPAAQRVPVSATGHSRTSSMVAKTANAPREVAELRSAAADASSGAKASQDTNATTSGAPNRSLASLST